MKPALENYWLHVQIIDGDVYVFTDDGHWKNTAGKEDWDNAKEYQLSDLTQECWLGSVNSHKTFLARIQLNPIPPTILIGKFGMPYVATL